MTTLIEYRKADNGIVAGIIDENQKLIGFTAADHNLERVTSETFKTADEVRQFLDGYKSLI